MSVAETNEELFDEMDEVRLPDQWGYDYKEWRLMSPYMLRSFMIVVVPSVAVLLLIAVGISL